MEFGDYSILLYINSIIVVCLYNSFWVALFGMVAYFRKCGEVCMNIVIIIYTQQHFSLYTIGYMHVVTGILSVTAWTLFVEYLLLCFYVKISPWTQRFQNVWYALHHSHPRRALSRQLKMQYISVSDLQYNILTQNIKKTMLVVIQFNSNTKIDAVNNYANAYLVLYIHSVCKEINVEVVKSIGQRFSNNIEI